MEKANDSGHREIGLYLHIPFCKSRCLYCGFYSTVGTSLAQRYVDALCHELRLRCPFLPRTVYLGGGTPSHLSASQLAQLFSTFDQVFGSHWTYIGGQPTEVTMECNPDDIDDDFVCVLRRLPVNRVSIGIQTFDDARLRFLHRRHTSSQAVEAVRRLRGAGISNLSIDLMFGFPGQTMAEWQTDIDQSLALHVEHISAYSLMYEEGTPLHRLLTEGQIADIDDTLYIKMYDTLVERMRESGYEHYEISNFALPGYHSRHNSSYWDNTPYIGLGAAAHSYDGLTRQWNVADLWAYIRSIEQGVIPSEQESLDTSTRFNDLVTTRLRTSKGIHLSQLRADFGDRYYQYLVRTAEPLISNGWLAHENGTLRLTLEGIHVSDTVMSELMYIESPTL